MSGVIPWLVAVCRPGLKLAQLSPSIPVRLSRSVLNHERPHVLKDFAETIPLYDAILFSTASFSFAYSIRYAWGDFTQLRDPPPRERVKVHSLRNHAERLQYWTVGITSLRLWTNMLPRVRQDILLRDLNMA